MKDEHRKKRFTILLGAGDGTAAFPHGYAGMMADIENFKPRIALEEVKVPTLIVHGDRDGDIPFQ